jgi:hypothetical protein
LQFIIGQIQDCQVAELSNFWWQVLQSIVSEMKSLQKAIVFEEVE